MLACFSDPGLHAVREAAGGRPVLGIAECGIFRALMLGERFGIIALSPSSIRRQQRMARVMGVDSRYAGSWSVGASAAETAGADIRGRLIEPAAPGHPMPRRCRGDGVRRHGLAPRGDRGCDRRARDRAGQQAVSPLQSARSC